MAPLRTKLPASAVVRYVRRLRVCFATINKVSVPVRYFQFAALKMDLLLTLRTRVSVNVVGSSARHQTGCTAMLTPVNVARQNFQMFVQFAMVQILILELANVEKLNARMLLV